MRYGLLTSPLATSALDAESETLVNAALASLLKGNNTTISIAHRLSTIKRSDQVVVLSPDGKVADAGSYKELSNKPGGAFMKLMEWQMSGGDASEAPKPARPLEQKGPPREAEESMARLKADAEDGEKTESVARDNAKVVTNNAAGRPH